MTDEEIGRNVSKAAQDLCRALDVAGGSGLQIGNVTFQAQQCAWDSDGMASRTRWIASVPVSRIIKV